MRERDRERRLRDGEIDSDLERERRRCLRRRLFDGERRRLRSLDDERRRFLDGRERERERLGR